MEKQEKQKWIHRYSSHAMTTGNYPVRCGLDVEPYTREQFYEITVHLLNNQLKIAPEIADGVWDTSRNIRDCIRIGKLARSEEDVIFLLNNFLLGREDG
jgi:hypothetical protein